MPLSPPVRWRAQSALRLGAFRVGQATPAVVGGLSGPTPRVKPDLGVFLIEVSQSLVEQGELELF